MAFDELGNRRDKNCSRDVTSVSTTFTSLGANGICAGLNRLPYVLRMADYVHIKDTGVVEFVDNVLRRNTDGGNKKPGTALDDDVNELV